jgi:hypothetical protein
MHTCSETDGIDVRLWVAVLGGNCGKVSDWSRSLMEGMSSGPREREPRARESFRKAVG